MEHKEELIQTATSLMAQGKGILAADESITTIGKRFEPLGIADTADMHRAYREMLFTSPGINQYISGVILYDETIRQRSSSGIPLGQVLSDQGIIPGIKVDLGPISMPESPEEKITEGLDGLDDRLAEYYSMGARFAKWRAVITIGKTLPTQVNVEANAELLAEYARLCQEAGIVPIVEPEVLAEGDNGIDKCEEVTANVLKTVFAKLAEKNVLLEGVLLKPNMITPGLKAPVKATPEQVAERTADVLLQNVPSETAGIVFLSGGQTEEQATLHLNLINTLGKDYPWPISFSYGRALQNSALQTWSGNEDKVEQAQQAFLHRAKMNSLAREGKYMPELELKM